MKNFLKIISYIVSAVLSIFSLVGVINQIYRFSEKSFLLEPSLINLILFIYYLCIDYITKDDHEFYKVKRFILWMFLLNSLGGFMESILN